MKKKVKKKIIKKQSNGPFEICFSSLDKAIKSIHKTRVCKETAYGCLLTTALVLCRGADMPKTFANKLLKSVYNGGFDNL